MSLSSREIDLVLAEADLKPGKVAKIVTLGYHRYALVFHGDSGESSWQWCLEAPWLRILFLKEAPRWKRSVHRFAALLNLQLTGALLEEVVHWEGERLLRFQFRTSDGYRILWVRLWTGASNIFLTTVDNTLIDAAFRRPARREVPGALFQPPAAHGKPSPDPRVFEGVGSYTEKLEKYYRTLERQTRLEAARNLVASWLQGQINAMETRLRNIGKAFSEDGSRDQTAGDLLMAQLHLVPPRAKAVELPDWEGRPVGLLLDPLKSAVENAQAYYAKARKARERLSRVQEEKEVLEVKLQVLEKDLQRLRIEPDESWLYEKASEIKKLPQQGKDQGTGLRFQIGAWPVLVGRNAQENEALLRGPVRGRDHWLHTRDLPGGFIFLKQIGNHPPPLQVLLDAGQLAVHYSKARGKGKTDVYWTQVKYLRRVKKGPPGKVIPTQEKNLSIDPDPVRLRVIMGGET